MNSKKEITLTINEKEFTAYLDNSSTSSSFEKLLPLTVKMMDLNSNEKYCTLDKDLQTKDVRFDTIEKGDILLFQSNCLVLFYKTFSSGYKYTRIGKIANVDGLQEAVGNSTIKVTFTWLRLINFVFI